VFRGFRRNRAATQIGAPASEEALRGWLIAHLAARVRIAPEAVDTTRTFEEYGLDSRVAVQVSGALERLLEHRLSPALLYEHQTIDALSAHLAQEMQLTQVTS
jgi:acyl carrier protein